MPEILSIAKEKKLLTPDQIHKLETNQHSRGHIAGGTQLEQDKLSRRYHAFIVLIPLMPRFFILFCLNKNLIRFFPSFINPFILVNITKMIKRDKYNEFRVRGWWMIAIESKNLLVGIIRKIFRSKELNLRNSKSQKKSNELLKQVV